MKKKVHMFVTPQSAQGNLVKIIEKDKKYGKILFKDIDLFNSDPEEMILDQGDINKRHIAEKIIRHIKINDGVLSLISVDPNIIELVYKLAHKTAMDYGITVHWVELCDNGDIHKWETGREHPKVGQTNINRVLENIFDQFTEVFDILTMLDNFSSSVFQTKKGTVDKSKLDCDHIEFLHSLRS